VGRLLKEVLLVMEDQQEAMSFMAISTPMAVEEVQENQTVRTAVRTEIHGMKKADVGVTNTATV
jgi:hypothetical protein